MTTCFTCLESSASVSSLSGASGASQESSVPVSRASRGQKRNAPPKKLPNEWLRDQFTVDRSKPEKVIFICVHCNLIAATSLKGTFNATKMSEHLRMKCSAASDDIVNTAFDGTQKNKKAKAVAATISASIGKQTLLSVRVV